MSLLGVPEGRWNESTTSMHDHNSPGCRACVERENKLVVPGKAEEGLEKYSVSLALAALRKQGQDGRKLVKSITRMAGGKLGTRAQFHGIIAAIIQQKDSAIRLPLVKSWVANAAARWNKLADTPKAEIEH